MSWSYNSLFLLVATFGTLHASSEIESKKITNSLISDIMHNSAQFNDARCLVLVFENMNYDNLPREQLENTNLVFLIYDSVTVSGIALKESGISCNHLIMKFGSFITAFEFLDNHYDNLRYNSNIPYIPYQTQFDSFSGGEMQGKFS